MLCDSCKPVNQEEVVFCSKCGKQIIIGPIDTCEIKYRKISNAFSTDYRFSAYVAKSNQYTKMDTTFDSSDINNDNDIKSHDTSFAVIANKLLADKWKLTKPPEFVTPPIDGKLVATLTRTSKV